MPFQSSDSPQVSRPAALQEDGPVLDGPAHGSEAGDSTLRIRARRFFPVSREELFATWTRRTAWDVWMRLRARSRSTLAPYRGGEFRLELAEGPAIHVITGSITDIQAPEHLTLSWRHENTNDPGSLVDVSFQRHQQFAELLLLHTHIASRREAAWLMRLWATVLARLETYLAEDVSPPTRRLRASSPFPRPRGMALQADRAC